MAKKEKVEKVQKVEDTLFDKTLSIFNEKYGEGYIRSLSEMRKDPVLGTSTGSLGLDSIINPKAGGVPKGHILELYGGYSSGKTTVALGICANATANGEKVVYIDAEGSLRPDLIVNAGVKEELFYYVDEANGNESALVADGLMKSGGVGVVVVDSIAAWKPPPANDDGDFTKIRVGGQSLFLSAVVPQLCTVARKHNIILIFINQIRDKIGGYGGGTKPYGGHIVEHYDGVRLKFSGKATNKTDAIQDAEGRLVGQNTTCFCDKNKTSIPAGEAVIPLFLGVGINPYLELVTLSQKTGVITGKAGYFKFAGSEETIVRGADEFAQALYDDTSLYKRVRSEVIERLGIVYSAERKVINPFHDGEYNKLR